MQHKLYIQRIRSIDMNQITKQKNESEIQTVFSIDDLKSALENIYRAKYVEGWGGHLVLATDGKKIRLCQFASGNSWLAGHETIFELEEWRTLSDEIEGLEWQENGMWKNDAGEIQTAKEILENVAISDIVDIDEIQEKLDEAITKVEEQ